MYIGSLKIGNIIAAIFLIIFTLIGIGIFIGGFFLQDSNEKFMKTAEKTSAVITSIERIEASVDKKGEYDYDVYISFVVNGVTYKGNLGDNYSSMQVGDSVTIYYNPKDPNEFLGSDYKSSGYTTVIVGAGIVLVGVYLSLSNYKSIKKYKEEVRNDEIRRYNQNSQI